MAPPRKQPQRVNQRRNERRRAEIDRRRANARKRGIQTVAAHHQRRRRWAVASAIVATVVVLTGAAVVLLRSGGDDGPSRALNASLVDGADGVLEIGEQPEAYAITYRVETFAGDDDTVTTEQVSVRRPFESLVVSLTDEPPGVDEQWSITTTLGQYQQTEAGQDSTAGTSPPTTALGDYRFDVSLADLVAEGSFVAGERRTLLGRECQVYRTGSPLESYAITQPTETDYVDACIDASGLVLEQLSVSGGEVAQHQTATSVEPAAELGDDTFAITATPTALADGGTERTDLATDVAPSDDYWTFSSPPAGYTLEHRYRLRRNASDDSTDTTTDPTGTDGTSSTVDTFADVYVNGLDVITVLQGPASADPGLDSTLAQDAQTTSLGTAQTATSATGSILEATPEATPDWFVRVTATMSRADLLSAVGLLTLG